MLQRAPRNAELFFQQRAVFRRIKQPQRRLVDRRALDGVERHLLHQIFEALGNRALAAPHRAQQIQNLLALLEPLRRVAEEAHDLFDRVLHAVELGKRGVAAYHLVGKQARQVRIIARVDDLGFTYRRQHALGNAFIRHGIVLAQSEVLVERHFLFAQPHVAYGGIADDIHMSSVVAPGKMNNANW